MLEALKKTRKKATVLDIPINTISPNPNQPRKFFDATALSELSDSIKEFGVLQPITVRKIRFSRKAKSFRAKTCARV
mgnify:CR=1 FL=1